MGAVQKLATVVIVGLTGLATLLVFLLADEPSRRDAEADEQEELAIERGIQTYITNCLACHGPAGEGYRGETGYVGAPIGGNTPERLVNQSEDPVLRAERENQIRTRIHGGSPIGCGTIYPNAQCAMPPWGQDFGGELNDEQIEELVLMIQNVDWDLVYNEAIHTIGAYPTPPGAAAPPSEEGGGEGEEGAPGAAIRLEAFDLGWRTADQPGPQVNLTLAPGAVIELVNVGAAAHNFESQGLGINEDMPVGYSGTITIPADAAPGTYDFVCNVVGHAAVMYGTITVDPNAAAPAEEDAPAEGGATPAAEGTPAAEDRPDAEATPAVVDTPAADEGTPEATPAASPEATPAAGPIAIEAYDFGFRTPDQPTGPITVTGAPGDTIQLTNTGVAPHNFDVQALGVFVDLPPGASGEAVIPADAPPGEYEFICNIPGHAATGMRGTLVITGG